ncbi:MAG: hypothetical protein U0232_09405 [Thermomicrobiales bacterium]
MRRTRPTRSLLALTPRPHPRRPDRPAPRHPTPRRSGRRGRRHPLRQRPGARARPALQPPARVAGPRRMAWTTLLNLVALVSGFSGWLRRRAEQAAPRRLGRIPTRLAASPLPRP